MTPRIVEKLIKLFCLEFLMTVFLGKLFDQLYQIISKKPS